MCPGFRTERAAMFVIALEKSAEGIVASSNPGEGLNGRKREVVACISLFAMRQNPVVPGLLAKPMGEARRQREPGTEANVAMHVRETPATSLFTSPPLNPPNRRMRTRMSGGVGGAKLQSFPLSRF